jgi:circadian clock protein KaiB
MNPQKTVNDRAENSLDYSSNINELVPPRNSEKYVFRLYIADSSIKSVAAVRQMQKLCEENLPGRYELEIIDIYRHPERLEGDQIFASPTLVKELPPPLQRLIGDLSDTEKVRISLEI